MRRLSRPQSLESLHRRPNRCDIGSARTVLLHASDLLLLRLRLTHSFLMFDSVKHRARRRKISRRGYRASEEHVMTKRRINYAGSVHDEREIDAVVDVLRGGPTALRIGRNVRNMEERVAALLGKRRGVMCNSGSSALYLAIEVLDLEPGDEIITAAVTFSTDLAPMLRPSSSRSSSTSRPTPSRSMWTPSRR